MNIDRQYVFPVIDEEYFVCEEADIASSSPSMPTLIPVQPRSADGLTPGELQTDRENGRCSPTYDRMGLSDRRQRLDSNYSEILEVPPAIGQEGEIDPSQLAVYNHLPVYSRQKTERRMVKLTV